MKRLFKVANQYYLRLANELDTIQAPPHPDVSQEINVPEADPVPIFEEEEEQGPDTVRERYDLSLDRSSVELLLGLIETGAPMVEGNMMDSEAGDAFLNHAEALAAYLKRVLQK